MSNEKDDSTEIKESNDINNIEENPTTSTCAIAHDEDIEIANEALETEKPQVQENEGTNTAGTSDCCDKTKESENIFGTKTSDGSSLISIMCRICYDDTLDEPIISPCKCKGTVGMMHKSCLERWLAESNTNRCDLCFHRFETERTTKFSVKQSFFRWLRHPPTSFAFPIRDMRSDMITCMILIPFSILLIYLCLFAAEYYNRHFSMVPIARWTSISVMFMGIVIILGFCTWIHLVLRYHSRVWYFWWQRETIVRINVTAHMQQM